MTFQTAAILLAWVAIVILGFAMAGLVRQMHVVVTNQNRVSSARPGPRVGSRVLEAEWLPELGPAVLLFADSNCAVCERVIPTVVGELPRQQADHIRLLYRGESSAHANYAIPSLGEQDQAFDYYNVSITPFAVAVRDGLVVDSGPVGSVHLLHRFVAEAMKGGDVVVHTA